MAASRNERVGIDELLADARRRLRRLRPREAHRASQTDGLIVDIRSEAQCDAQGRVPGAHFVPRNVLEWRADPGCSHHDPVLVAVRGPLILMCAEGFQSSLAAATLQELGLPNATDMIGGFDRWRADGLPTLPARRGLAQMGESLAP